MPAARHGARLDGGAALQQQLGHGRVPVGAGEPKRRGIILRGVTLSIEPITEYNNVGL